MTCEEALILISGHLDGTNTQDEAAQLREHLDNCDTCRSVMDAFLEADAGLLALAEQAPADLCDNVMQQIRREAKPKVRKRWAGMAVAAGLVLVISIGAASGFVPVVQDQPAAEPMARHAAAPAEYTVYEETAYEIGEDIVWFDHTILIDPQTLADERGCDLVVTHTLLPEMETCSCETLENGALLYHLESSDGAVQLSRTYGVELYQPAEQTQTDVSYALLTP